MTVAITANTNLTELARDFYQRVRDAQNEAAKKSLFEGYLQNLNGNHQQLPELGRQCNEKVCQKYDCETYIITNKPYNVGTLRTQVRDWLSTELREIDGVLRRMLEE